MGNSSFSTRLGFILVSAGCAIGLGNVWRFPFITGKYGGASFVLLSLVFLAILGLPIMVSEFAVGRASVHSAAKSFDILEPEGTKWHLYKYGCIIGNIMLMMYYTMISGWMFYYLYKMAAGAFIGLDPKQVGAILGGLVSDPVTMTAYTCVVCILGGAVCYLGVQSGVERITKIMMTALLFLMVALAIFGSYIGKEKRLTGEAVWIIVLDTSVALMAGLIIFPACFSYGINPGAGPNLLFVTLPNVFNHMPGGRFWGSLFFLFMIFASMSTVIAVFENLIACFIDLTGLDRKTIVRRGVPAMIFLSLPCILGFNVWSGFQPFGPGTGILDLEDFVVSNNLLPLGSLVYLAFCTSRYGWGWNHFIKEADTGKGLKFPKSIRFYVTYILPVIVLYIFVNGYIAIFGH